MPLAYAAVLSGYGCFPKALFSFKSKMTVQLFQRARHSHSLYWLPLYKKKGFVCLSFHKKWMISWLYVVHFVFGVSEKANYSCTMDLKRFQWKEELYFCWGVMKACVEGDFIHINNCERGQRLGFGRKMMVKHKLREIVTNGPTQPAEATQMSSLV